MCTALEGTMSMWGEQMNVVIARLTHIKFNDRKKENATKITVNKLKTIHRLISKRKQKSHTHTQRKKYQNEYHSVALVINITR